MGASFSELFDDVEEDLERQEHKTRKEVNFDDSKDKLEEVLEKKIRSRSPPPQSNSLIQTKVKTRKRRQKQQREKTASYRKW
jgi:hypothetical protein